MATRSEGTGPESDPLLAVLLERGRLVDPASFPALVREIAQRSGAVDATMYVVDYDQKALIPLPVAGVPAGDPLDIDSTLAGRVYRTLTVLEGQTDAGRRLLVPLLDSTTRVGVLELVVVDAGEAYMDWCERFADLATVLLAAKMDYGDIVHITRRRQPMSIAAEMQWNLLPPLTFTTNRMVISGALEPSYTIAGDSFDYALNGDLLHFGIIDAMGHGFEAAVMASVAIGAYRHSRRSGDGLQETYASMDDVLGRHFGPYRFATAQLAELDVSNGRLRWLNAGHPAPLLLRAGRVVDRLRIEPTLPVGFGGAVADVGDQQLEPGDVVLWFTDGVVEARSPEGRFFGEDRLAELAVRALGAGLPAPETTRRLVHAILDHQRGRLQDDASLMLVSWLGPHGQPPGWSKPPRR